MSLCLDKTNWFHFFHRHDLLKINLWPTLFQNILKHKLRYYLWVLLSSQHPDLNRTLHALLVMATFCGQMCILLKEAGLSHGARN